VILEGTTSTLTTDTLYFWSLPSGINYKVEESSSLILLEQLLVIIGQRYYIDAKKYQFVKMSNSLIQIIQ
jgi:hypothetical protein